MTGESTPPTDVVDDDSPTEERTLPNAADDELADPSATPSPESSRWRRPWLAPSVVGVLVVASAALLACLVFFLYLPDQRTGDAAATAAVTAASDSTVAVLSYTPESLDSDFAKAKSHLTGEFLTYYSKFTDQMVGPTAKQKAIKTTASVAQAALSEIHPDSAVVLVYVNQSTQSAERPDPSITASSVLVTLEKVNGTWLVSAFNPI